MAVVPKARDELLTFFQLRVEAWLADPASIGLEAQQAAEVAAALEALAEAEREAIDLKRRTMSAVARAAIRDEQLRRVGGAAINTIRAFARATDDPDVFARASLPSVRPRSPLPAPQAPVNVRPRLTSHGTVEVTWQASVAHGTTFLVYRRLLGAPETAGMGPLEFVGAAHETSITDQRIPPRILGLLYTVRAMRGRKQSPFSALASMTLSSWSPVGRARKAA